MKAIDKIDRVYGSAPYEIKLKARISIVLLLFFDGLYTLFLLNFVLHSTYNYLFFTFIIAEAALIFATYSLLNGRYDLAIYIISPTFFISISVALSTMGLESYSYIFESAAYGSIFLIVSLFLRSKKVTMFFAGFILFSCLVHILIDILNHSLKVDSILLMVAPSIAFLLVFIGAGIANQSIFRKILSDLAGELERSQEAEEKSLEIVTKVAEQMNQMYVVK